MSVRIPDLIGVTVDDSRCILSEAQVLRLGMLLLRLRPADSDGVSFLGGALSALATTPTASAVAAPMPHALGDMLGDDAFLVLAGPNGALALLTARTLQGYATRLYSDPERVDRAALVLAQFGDVPYALDMTANPESQRALAVRVLLAVMSDSELRGADLNALFPDEHNWLRMARNLSEHPDPATVLTIPPVQQVIRACGGQRALVGTLDARRVLRVLAASDTTAPLELNLNQPTLTPLLQTLRPSSIAADAWLADGQAWVQQAAVTLIPLTRKQELAGALLVTSERPLSLSARATLNALGVLLNAYLSARPVPTAPAAPAAPVATTLPPRNATATPAALRAPQTSPLGPSLVSPPARSVPTAAPARTVAPPLSGIEALLDRIDEGIIVVEPTGALASFNAAAAQLLNLTDPDRNRALAETAAHELVPLFTEALLGETVQRQPLTLASGTSVQVSVSSLPGERWALLLHPQPTQNGVAPTAPAASDDNWIPAMPGIGGIDAAAGDYNEALLAGFSNSIRGPLHSLRELIARVPAAGQLNEQQSVLIGQVVQLNTELTMLVNDLLTLGQVRYQMAEMSGALRLDLLVEAAIGTRYAEFGRRGQRVELGVDPDLPRVIGSEEGLGRVIGALLDNAILYTPPGSQIAVQVVQQDGQVVVTVEDNGPGLEPDEAAQVFEPFYRAPLAEQLGVEGRGLGLTIARAVIEHHRGRIWVESVAGQGCRFAFSLPSDPESV